MPHLTVRLPAEDLARLRATAELRRVPVSRLVRWGVRRVTTDTLAEAAGGAGRTLPIPAGEDLVERRKPLEDTDHEVPVEERRPDQLPRTGNELCAWRKALGWTQAKLAQALGVSRRTVISAEGRGNDPLTSTVLTRLAELG